MRNEIYELNAPVSVASGASREVKELTGKTIQISGTFTATCRIQGTIDGDNWFDLTGDLSAASIFTLTDSKGAEYTLSEIRVNVTAFTDGVIIANLSAYNQRTM